MEPIISPWLIYLVETAGIIKGICEILTLLFIVATGVILMAYGETDLDKGIHYAKCTGIIFIICLVLAVLIPNKQTAWMMIGASYVTPDNITAVQGNLVEFAKQIMQATK